MNQLNSNASELTLQQMASHENMMLFAQAAMKASNSFYNTQGGVEESQNLPNLGKKVGLINGSTKNLPNSL